ncbi:hypothetical protein QBC37DRAFT_121175 [Rhypophila decipiens]|uniref:Alpha-galactosidase A n=1 Tax=Rhypophila decipiens TaxID=261697 RepID=A0AAN7B1N5_9PEZI|nr:hypothetical protein QBC37DRAFT_121175 [Rhypophila decipiens]
MESTNNNNVQLLAALVDADDQVEDGEYRFLVDGTHVKYVTVEPGILPEEHRTFGPLVLASLPPFPPGDWNTGHVSRDSNAAGHGGEQLAFVRTEKVHLARVENIWYPTRFDHLEFTKLERLRQNIHIVSHPDFDHPVVVKFTEFPWQTPYLEAETAAYEWIEGHDMGPRFLGHLTEEGRVFGFVVEYISNVRPAGPEDLQACREVLGRLHGLGIKHGDINKNNFLMRRDGGCVLIDFETATKDASEEDMQEEMRRLGESLADPSKRGWVPPVDLGERKGE